MSAQLELDLARTPSGSPASARPAPRELARRACLGVLHWTPVWVPLLFLGQVLVLGFLPARAEDARLDRAAAEVGARAAALEEEERELAERMRMLEDPVFRERVRRSLVDPGAPPLSLERARTASRP